MYRTINKILEINPTLFIFCISSVVLFTGCSTLKKPELVADFFHGEQINKTALLIDKKARECWEFKKTPFESGIYITTRLTKDKEIEVAAWRSSWGEERWEAPFTRIILKPSMLGTKITIYEGDYECGLTECYKYDLAKHVKTWLYGDLACIRSGEHVPNYIWPSEPEDN